MSPFKHGLDYADVLLPVAPFTETAGTYVNAEGTVQSFNGVVRPLGDTRPGWKVLRVLGSLLGLPNFEYETAEEVRLAALGDAGVASRLSNQTSVAPVRVAVNAANGGFERLADVPIYHADALVRRAGTAPDGRREGGECAALPAALFDKLGLKEGDAVRVRGRACGAVAGRARRESCGDRRSRVGGNACRRSARQPVR